MTWTAVYPYGDPKEGETPEAAAAAVYETLDAHARELGMEFFVVKTEDLRKLQLGFVEGPK